MADLAKDTADKIIDEAKAALGMAESGLAAEPTPLEAATGGEEAGDARKPVLIKDVYAWRAGMQVSCGVRPTRGLDEFVEVVEKL